MKIGCGIVEDILPLYADGICSEESREAVETHCAECEKCSEKLAAMTAVLPEKRVSGKPVNPIKKIVGHYLRIAALTLVCSLAVGAGIYKAIELSANENDLKSVGTSWSTLQCNWDFRSFGELFEKGNYYDAMSMADIRRINISSVTDEEQDMMYTNYADACERFFGEYPIESYSVKAYNYDFNEGQIRVEVSLMLNTPNNAPVSVVYVFSKDRRDTEGRFCIEETKIVLDKGFNDTNTEHDVLERYRLDLANVWVSFPQFNYADNWFAAHFIDDIESGDYYSASKMLLTAKRQMLDEVYYDPMDIAPGGLNFHDYAFEQREREGIDMSAANAVEELFARRYKIETYEYSAPMFEDRVIYKGTVYNEHGCFIQHFDIGMRNGDEVFRVSFSVAVTNLAHAVMPAEDIVFSDNAPEDFKSLFLELFGE